MTASELRELAERLTKIVPADLEAAAEVLEFIAWAEERCLGVRRFGCSWVVCSGSLEYCGDTLIDTLRRAREVAR